MLLHQRMCRDARSQELFAYSVLVIGAELELSILGIQQSAAKPSITYQSLREFQLAIMPDCASMMDGALELSIGLFAEVSAKSLGKSHSVQLFLVKVNL